MIQQFAQPSGCSAALDPISMNRAARIGFGGLDRGSALFSFILGFIFSWAMGILWWLYDLMSTYYFSQGISADAKPVATSLGESAGELLGSAGDITLASFMGGVVVVAITLAPSIVELLAPRVMHPGAQLALNATILFDFVTDWPTAAGIIAQYNVPFGWLGQVIATFLLTLVLSLGIQVLFVLAITVTLASAWALLKGPNTGGDAIIIQR